MKPKSILARFLAWRTRHIKHKHFVLIISFIVGLISGLAAVLLKSIVHFTHHFLTHKLPIQNTNLLYLAYPIAGIFLTVIFIKFFIKDKSYKNV